MRTTLIWILAVPWTVLMGTVSLFASLFDRRKMAGFRCMQIWARGLLKLSSVTLQTIGFENIVKDRNYLIVSNHQSQVDIVALSAAIPFKFGWMAKRELFRIPFLGWHMSRMGYVPIDRSSIKSSTSGLMMAANVLKNGASLVIFPEGSRSVDGKLKPFKDGAFFIAVESQVPILPITIRGTADILKKGSSKINKGGITITVSEIINVENFKHSDRDKLKEIVRGSIVSKIIEEN